MTSNLFGRARLQWFFGAFAAVAASVSVFTAQEIGAAAEESPIAVSTLLREMQASFTAGGKPVPPELFRDIGDGDLADGASVMVAADLAVAVDSNRYPDAIEDAAGWRVQKSVEDETAYQLAGQTANGLLAIVTRYSAGGTGIFYNLHIVDVHPAEDFDAEGHRQERVELTMIRTVPLGDRWTGHVAISGNAISITTSGGALAESNGRDKTVQIMAQRP